MRGMCFDPLRAPSKEAMAGMTTWTWLLAGSCRAACDEDVLGRSPLFFVTLSL